MLCGLLAAAALVGSSAGAAAAALGWLPAQAISAPGAAGAGIALGERGDAVAVWQRAVGDDSVVEAAAHPATGGGWASPAMLGAPGDEARAPAAAVDGAGNAVAAYERYDRSHWRIAVSTRPATTGAWSAPVDVSAAGQDARDARVALDASGGALAAWERRNGLGWAVEAAARPAGGDWSAPTQLSEAVADARNLQIAMAPGGTAVLVWERPGLQTAVEAAVRAGGAGPPQAGETISESGASALSPQVAIDAAGNATVAWEDFDG